MIEEEAKERLLSKGVRADFAPYNFLFRMKLRIYLEPQTQECIAART